MGIDYSLPCSFPIFELDTTKRIFAPLEQKVSYGFRKVLPLNSCNL